MRAAPAQGGLTLEPGLLVERPYELGEARESLRTLMSAAPPPTAVACGNDVLAMGGSLEVQVEFIVRGSTGPVRKSRDRG